MCIVEKFPKKIVWRTIEYYIQDKVLEVHEDGGGLLFCNCSR